MRASIKKQFFIGDVYTHYANASSYVIINKLHFSSREGIHSRCRRFGSIFHRYDRYCRWRSIDRDRRIQQTLGLHDSFWVFFSWPHRDLAGLSILCQIYNKYEAFNEELCCSFINCCIVFYHCALFMTEQPGDTLGQPGPRHQLWQRYTNGV